MKLIPHSHLGMPGRVQQHTLVYLAGVAALLAVFLDLSRIASMGAILYLLMDLTIHWGVLRHLRSQIGASAAVVITAIVLDSIVLGAFIWYKAWTDPLILGAATALVLIVVGFVAAFLRVRAD